MKKAIRLMILAMVMVLLVLLSGCNPTLTYDKVYTEYIYYPDATYRPSGRLLTINSNETFSIVMNEQDTLEGLTELLYGNSLKLKSDPNVLDVLMKRYEDSILNNPYSEMPIDMLHFILDTFNAEELIYYYKQFIFSSFYIVGHRYIDNKITKYGTDYSQFEGVYYLMKEGMLALFKHGEVFIQDEEPVAGQFPYPIGSYIYANNFLTITFYNDESTVERYLVADTILPEELSEDDEYEWYGGIGGDIEDHGGKTVKVLVLCFYSSRRI